MALVISASALEDARIFFEGVGVSGLEGTGAFAGTAQGSVQRATRFVRPDQVAHSDFGCSIEVTQKGKLQLASNLLPDELYVARIHSHPAEAFHSPTDNRNPFLTAEGSWSIVAPFFGLGLRRGLDLCAIYRLVDGKWIRVPISALGVEIRVQQDG